MLFSRISCAEDDLCAVISPYDGPCDGVILEVHSDTVAVVRQSLTVNHLPAGRISVQRGNPQRVARLPSVSREYASAAWTDVIRVGLLFSIAPRRRTVREAHNYNDQQPPFHPASE